MNDERINRIIDILEKNEGIAVKELADFLQVSQMTIRRDIEKLKSENIVRNVSGAIMLNRDNNNASTSYSLLQHLNEYSSEKEIICKKAASFVEDGDIVYIDIGSTVASIIDYFNKNLKITAVCCTLNAMTKLYKNNINNVYMLGGKYQSGLQMFYSENNRDDLKNIRLTKAFISAAGVEGDSVTCVNDIEVSTKQTAIRNAAEKYLLVDSSKFDVIKPYQFAKLEDFDYIVTDDKISKAWRKKIKDAGIKLIIA